VVDEADVLAERASSSAKLFVVFAVAFAPGYAVPPVVAAETAGVGSIIVRVVGIGGRFLSRRRSWRGRARMRRAGFARLGR
jgi:hypothetical protein